MAGLRPAVRAWLVDVGVTVAVAAVIQVAIAVATEPDSRPAGAVGHLLGLLMALPLLAHRRFPAGALYASAVILVVYYSANFPGFAPTPVLLVPLYFATEAGRVRWTAPSAAFFLAAGVVVGFSHHDPPLGTAAHRPGAARHAGTRVRDRRRTVRDRAARPGQPAGPGPRGAAGDPRHRPGGPRRAAGHARRPAGGRRGRRARRPHRRAGPATGTDRRGRRAVPAPARRGVPLGDPRAEGGRGQPALHRRRVRRPGGGRAVGLADEGAGVPGARCRSPRTYR